MKIHILQENLLKLLTRTNRILSSKTQLPVLQNILLESGDGILTAITTNMEMSMISSTGAKTEKSGKICIPAKLLLDFVLTLPQETVVLEEKDGEVSVSTARSKALLPTTPYSEFPDIKKTTEKKDDVKIERDILKDSLKGVLFAAASDEGRPVLTGLKLNTAAENLVFASTDGYRLSVKKVKYKTEGGIDMVVPAKAFSEVYKIISEDKEEEGPVSLVKTQDNQLELVMGDTRIIARIIDGEYPDYSKIIPKTHTTRAVFDKNEFLHAVKTASIFARENANIVRVNFTADSLTVSANSPQTGKNTVTVDSKLDGDENEIAFNSRFLMDFLNNTEGESLAFEMTGSLNPGLFRVEGDESYFHIIMPVRVQN